ncbi:uncharacterized protein K02A2.6-like, partial [Tachysurus ichikawai]
MRHVLSPPYYPATNGQAKRVVQTFKKAWERYICSSTHVLKHQAQQKCAHDAPSRKIRSFEAGQKVMVRDCQHSNRAWLPGVILFKHGPLTYQVQVGDRSVKVHVDHLVSSNVKDRVDTMGSTIAIDFAPDVSDKGNSSVTQSHAPVEKGTVPSPERRYPFRQKKTPNRLDL